MLSSPIFAPMLATLTLRKAAQAEEIARLILQSHAERRVFALKGDLGAGKTTLTQGFCAALGVADRPSSPSFSIVNEYRTTDGGTVYHFDLYRLKNAEELDGIGFDEYLDNNEYTFVNFVSHSSLTKKERTDWMVGIKN